jgi:hypothetical protein
MFKSMRPRALGLAAAAAFAGLASPLSSAEIQKMMVLCQGGKLCPWFQARVAPPKGWIEDKDEGAKHFVAMFLPDKTDVGENDPMIYVQTSYHRDQQTLAENVKMNQDLWRKSEPKARITALAPAPRGAGKEPFQVFLYENPSRPEQAFEKMAYGLEPLPDGGHYILTVADTASTRKAIDDSSEAFQAILGGL